MKDFEDEDEVRAFGGLSTSEGLKILLSDVESVIAEEDLSSREGRSREWLQYFSEAFSPRSTTSLYPTSGIFWSGVTMIFLVCFERAFLCAGFLFLSLIFNFLLSLNETRLRRTEIRRRISFVLDRLRSLQKDVFWTPGNYPHLHTPIAASVVLQWTLRDEKQVNLPWALLVRKDVILIKPGQVSPGDCQSLNDPGVRLSHGDTLHIKTGTSSKIFSPTPEFRTPAKPEPFRLLETPYLKIVREFLRADENIRKPPSLLTKYAHFFFVRMPLHYVIPGIFCITVLRGLMKRYLFEEEEDSFLGISAAIIPLITTVFPISWLLSNMVGFARVLEVFNSSRHLQLHEEDPFEEPENIQPLPTKASSSFPLLKKYFWSALLSSGEFFTRRENIVHALGSVNALCCTDKKGILSWPNTSAEKIFFLKSQENKISSEILTVTHDHQNPFKVEFDDPSWVQFMNYLKPVGLGILLNTCNLITEEKYTNFYNHLICESFQKDDLLPIATRGCLCELARKIGFHGTKTAQDYSLTSQIQIFRHVKLDCHDKFARNLSLARLKFPFPHMVSVLVQQRSMGTRQLFSQGTADIILDSCVDFWSGKDLENLTDDARKKILDFYQRASLSSYCTAFSYRPLTFEIPWKNVKEYLQLPTHSLPFYVHYSDPVHLYENDADYNHISLGNADKSGFDADYHKDDYDDRRTKTDALKCLEIECNQTFLGMVQLQYQPFVDLVQLVDLLEKACIRFVHFSKENELRSRVFSEKMGLESGWNCHISLKSQNTIAETESTIVSYTGPHSRTTLIAQSKENRQLYLKNILGSSLPTDLSRPSWFLDFPQWRDSASSVSEGDDEEDESKNRRKKSDQRSVGSDSTNPFDYDMSNRAKLPRGIENIRPHLQTMDDVPLLVSLFTDCTPATTREMLVIMQEYGEVVCVLGSSSNYTNTGVFLQADGSLGIEPLYPQICQSVPVFTPPKSGGPGPVELAGFLNSLVCSLSFKRKDEVSIFHLLLESRNFVLCFINCLQFWISSLMYVSGLQLISLLMDVSSLLSVYQALWLSSIFIPILSLSFNWVPTDSNVMNVSTGKNLVAINFKYGLWCYGFRFFPSAIILLICHGLSSNVEISILKNLNLIFLELYLVLISHSFLFRSDQTWKKFYCKIWCIIVGVLFGIRITYSTVFFYFLDSTGASGHVWGLWCAGLIIIPLINEVVKRQEIKVSVRNQKRARLEFGTKLGINSPF